MIRNAALLAIILLAAPVVAAADAPNPMATPTPVPKINTDVKVVPGLVLGTPKPTACPGPQSIPSAKSANLLLSSCSGAPGTVVTMTGAAVQNITNASVMYTLNGRGPYFFAAIQHAQGPPELYFFSIPQFNQGPLSPCYSVQSATSSFTVGLVMLYGSSDPQSQRIIGNFTVSCVAQTKSTPAPTQGTVPASQCVSGSSHSTPCASAAGFVCTGAPNPEFIDFLVSSCSGAPGSVLTLTTTVTGASVGFSIAFYKVVNAPPSGLLPGQKPGTPYTAAVTVNGGKGINNVGSNSWTATVPQVCGLYHMYASIQDLGVFTVCPSTPSP
jgi:hypothetical protein